MQKPSSGERQSAEQSLVSLSESGDATEQEWWPQLQTFVSKYEVLWRMHVEPLRSSNSIYLRDGIDADFETFAMNHYTAFVNLARALDKIQRHSDDLKYAEEIWSNLQRVAEVAANATSAFKKIYRKCTHKDPRINTAKLLAVTDSLKKYRNVLHDRMPGTVMDSSGMRLIPRREIMEKYSLWTTAMYHRDDSDFVPVEAQLQNDFARLCAILQDLWGQIEDASHPLVTDKDYLALRAAGTTGSSMGSVVHSLAASGTFFGPQGSVK
jgi:hypothetical protein